MRGKVALLLALMLIITYLVYQPGMSGAFLFDDNPNIANNSDIVIQDFHLDTLRRAAFSSGSGPLRRPISMLSFATNYYFTAFDPFYFKMTNLVIHLCSGLGIFVLGYLLLTIYRKRYEPSLSDWQMYSVSLAVSAAWLLHPFNLTSVLYVVQRMTSLSALFAIWGLVIFLWGRTRLLDGKAGVIPILLSVLFFTPLAALSKETGALLPGFMLLIEITLLDFQTEKPSARRFLTGFFAVTVVLPALAVLAFVTSHPAWLLSGYQSRSFTLTERVMTEARVLWFYLRLIVLPSDAAMGLYHDDIIISQGLLKPITTLPSLIGIVALFVFALFSRKKTPLVSFGILFFLLGHALESTIFPLEIAHEHRNYLPMFGILLIVFFYLLYPLKYAASLRLRQIAALLLIGLFAYDTWVRSTIWSNPFDLAKNEVENHPNSARTNGEMGSIYGGITSQDPSVSEAFYQATRHFYQQSIVVDPNYTLGLFGLILISSARGKDIDPYWISELEHRLQFSPAENDTGNNLIQLINCQIEKKCKLDQGTLEGLINAALKNPTAIGPKRALLLSCLSYYMINFTRNYPAALNIMYQTVESAPQELEYRLTLVKFLGALRRTEEAKSQLAILKHLDSLKSYTVQIAAQQNLLTKNDNSTRH